jgi:hypothetical protein
MRIPHLHVLAQDKTNSNILGDPSTTRRPGAGRPTGFADGLVGNTALLLCIDIGDITGGNP